MSNLILMKIYLILKDLFLSIRSNQRTTLFLFFYNFIFENATPLQVDLIYEWGDIFIYSFFLILNWNWWFVWRLFFNLLGVMYHINSSLLVKFRYHKAQELYKIKVGLTSDKRPRPYNRGNTVWVFSWNQTHEACCNQYPKITLYLVFIYICFIYVWIITVSHRNQNTLFYPYTTKDCTLPQSTLVLMRQVFQLWVRFHPIYTGRSPGGSWQRTHC